MDALRPRYAGDDWDYEWTTTEDVSDWSSPVIVLRDGRGTDATVLATNQGGSPTITTTGTSFATGTFKWQIAKAVTVDFTPGDGWLEVEVLIDGRATTVMSQPQAILPQTAVRA